MSKENSFSAKAIRAGYDSSEHFNSVNPPIYQTASFDLQDNRRSPIEFIPGAPVIASLKIFFAEFFGGALGSFESFLVLQGLSTLSVRLDKKVVTTRKIVDFLESRDEVEYVRYPYAKGSRYRALADIPKNIIRLSIGLEDAEDLIQDLEQAFEKAFK